MLRAFWIALLLIVVGVIIVVLPDYGKSLYKINQYHGPSVQDTVGLAILILVWLWMLCRVIFKWKKVILALQIKGITIALLLVVTGTVIVIVTLAHNTHNGWIPGAVVAIAGYAIPFIAAFKKN